MVGEVGVIYVGDTGTEIMMMRRRGVLVVWLCVCVCVYLNIHGSCRGKHVESPFSLAFIYFYSSQDSPSLVLSVLADTGVFGILKGVLDLASILM